MKSTLTQVLALCVLFGADTFAAEETESLVTRDGKEFTGVKFLRIEGLRVSLSHSRGLATIDVRDLPETFRRENSLLPTLLEKKENYHEDVRQWLAGYEKLNEQYEGALARLEQELIAVGDLDSVVGVRNERDTFRSTPRVEKPNQPKLAELTEKYKSAKDQWMRDNDPALVRITQAYLSELKTLESRLSSEGDTAQAEAAEREHQMLELVQNDAVAIQTTLGIGPGIVKAAEAAVSAHPDGILTEKRAGDLLMYYVGDKFDVSEPEAGEDRSVVEVQADSFTWAAMNRDGRLFSSKLNNGSIPVDHKEVTFFRVGSGMVLAFHSDGSMSTFGDPVTPADLPPDDLKFVSDCALSQGNGIALLSTGKVRVWGAVYAGDEKKSKAVEEALTDIRFIDTSEQVTWAVDAQGQVHAMKGGSAPEIVGQHDNITHFRGGKSDYLVLVEGGALMGGSLRNEDPTQYVPEGRREGIDIRLNYWGYALQFKDGSWYTWGGFRETAPLHGKAIRSGRLHDLEISASPERFVIMVIQ